MYVVQRRALCSNAPDGFVAVAQLFAQVASACVVLAVTTFAIGLGSPQIATKTLCSFARRRQLRSQTGDVSLQLQSKRACQLPEDWQDAALCAPHCCVQWRHSGR